MWKIKILTYSDEQPTQETMHKALAELNGRGSEYEYTSICPVCGKTPTTNWVDHNGHEYHKSCFNKFNKKPEDSGSLCEGGK